MGFGLPAALGAALGAPDRTVVCVVGDGGLQMTIQELATIYQTQAKVKVLLLNNDSWAWCDNGSSSFSTNAILRLK